MKLTVIRKNPLSLPVLMAENLGIFSKYNVNISLNIIDDFPFDGNNPFLNGNSDGMIGDTTFFFYMLKKGKKAIITSNLTRTISLIIRNEAIDKERYVAGVNRAGLFRLFLEGDLIHLKDKVDISWDTNTYDRIEKYKSGEIDLLVAIEPFVSDVIEIGGEVLYKHRESKNNYVMWAFDEKYYNENRNELKLFYKAIQEAQDIFNSSSEDEKYNICKSIGGYNEKYSKRATNIVFEEYDNYKLDDFNICQEWMYRVGEIDNLYDGNKHIGNVFD